jgi:hypothetical protein
MEYMYSDIATAPNLNQVHVDIAGSAMTDKNIEYCRWDETEAHVHVCMQSELSGGDKTILDGIVADNS